MTYRPNDYKTPRSMSQAFGPYAQLTTTQDHWFVRLARYVWSIFR